MRIGKVIGRITLNTTYETLVGGRFLVCEVQDRFGLAGQARKTSETVVVYDHLGAGVGETIAFTESREASMPFYPEKKVPLDAYCAAIIDHIDVTLTKDGA
jgi:microcompartment protein CcmK/EutM